jgi:hypothetical protein
VVFSIRSYLDLCERLGSKKAALLIAFRSNYKWNFSNLEKVPESEDLRILAFFKIFKIPLLSTSIGLAKCFDFFCFSVRCSVDICVYLCGKSGSTLHGFSG